MAQFPFPKQSPTENTAVPEVAPVRTKKDPEDRKKPAPPMNLDQVKQIITLVKTHSYSDIAEKIGVTKFQVNRILMQTKKQLRENAAGDPDKLAKIEEYIDLHLSRPEDPQQNKSGKGGKVKDALDNIVGDILASIQ